MLTRTCVKILRRNNDGTLKAILLQDHKTGKIALRNDSVIIPSIIEGDLYITNVILTNDNKLILKDSILGYEATCIDIIYKYDNHKLPLLYRITDSNGNTEDIVPELLRAYINENRLKINNIRMSKNGALHWTGYWEI